jgi:putative tricarboxylic transport membrane protein
MQETPGAVKAAPGPHIAPGPLIAGGVLVAAGGLLFAQAVAAGLENGVTLGGPTLAPIIVTGLWLVVALAFFLARVREKLRPSPPAPSEVDTPEEPIELAAEAPGVETGRTDRFKPFLLLTALIAYSLILKYTVAGYILATTAFFFASARLLGGRPTRQVILRDLVVAAVLAIVIYLCFTRLLGIVLPAGVLPL